MECPTVEKVVSIVRLLNEFEFTQELLAQLEQLFKTSPIASINWAAHVVLMNSKLKLGLRYWYMKQTLECGWSSNILDIQVKNDLFQRQIKEKKVNNFTVTLPEPQSDLANYNQPMGISDYQLSKAVPEDLKSTFPSIEEVEQELSQLLERNEEENR